MAHRLYRKVDAALLLISTLCDCSQPDDKRFQPKPRLRALPSCATFDHQKMTRVDH
jgi:hypothetical protein